MFWLGFLVGASIVAIVWLFVWLTRPIEGVTPTRVSQLHEPFCTCVDCKQKMVEREVKEREWIKQYRATRSAVDQMDRDR